MKTIKRGLSLTLSLALLAGVLAVGGVVSVPASASAELREAPKDVYFVVPEVVYLNPNAGNNTMQYFADSKIVDPEDPARQASFGLLDTEPGSGADPHQNSSGDVWFYCENASKVKISVRYNATVTISRRVNKLYSLPGGISWSDEAALSSQLVASSFTGNYDSAGNGTTDNFYNDLGASGGDPYTWNGNFIYFSIGNASTSAADQVIGWQADYLVNGIWYTAYAYSYAYKPNNTPAGAMFRNRRGGSGCAVTSLIWVNGLHNNPVGNFYLAGQDISGGCNTWESLHSYVSSRESLILRQVVRNGAGTMNAFSFTSTGTTTVNNNPTLSDGNNGGNGYSSVNNYYEIEGIKASSSTPSLYVDTSRYKYYDQIPNLKVYASKTSSYEDNPGTNRPCTSSVNYISWTQQPYENGNRAVVPSTGSSASLTFGLNALTNSGYNRGLGASSSNNDILYLGASTGYCNNNLIGGRWGNSAISGGITVNAADNRIPTSYDPNPMFHDCSYTSATSSDMTASRIYLTLSYNKYDKGLLRDYVRGHIKDYAKNQSALYSNAGTHWAAYQNAWYDLCWVLNRPDIDLNGSVNAGAYITALENAYAQLQRVTPDRNEEFVFNVPETVYLTPHTTQLSGDPRNNNSGYFSGTTQTSTTVDFYLGHTSGSSSKLYKNSAAVGGIVDVRVPGASSVSLSLSGTGGFTNPNYSGTTRITELWKENGNISITNTQAKTDHVLTWTLTYVINGVTYTQTSYTYVYDPSILYTQAGATSSTTDNTRIGAWFTLSGWHRITNNSSSKKNSGNSTVTDGAIPLIWANHWKRDRGNYSMLRGVSLFSSHTAVGGGFKSYLNNGYTNELQYASGENEWANGGTNNSTQYYSLHVQTSIWNLRATAIKTNVDVYVDYSRYQNLREVPWLEFSAAIPFVNDNYHSYLRVNIADGAVTISDVNATGQGGSITSAYALMGGYQRYRDNWIYGWDQGMNPTGFYAQPVLKPLTAYTGTGTDTQTYTIFAESFIRKDGNAPDSNNDYRKAFAGVELNVRVQNKAQLRAAYQDAANRSFQADAAAGSVLTNYQNAMAEAGKALGNPAYGANGENITSALTNLQSAVAALPAAVAQPLPTLTVHHICNTCAESGEALSAAYISTTDGNNYVGGTTPAQCKE
ncbi:MAG: hypothetical protein FWH26_10685, partial [Oscillospiraceae bacterium]|nr:hypothetical protein [Oscillospiraceae bacterium]